MEIILTDNAYKARMGTTPATLKELSSCKNESASFQLFLKEKEGILSHSNEKTLLPNLTLPVYRVEIVSDVPIESFIETYLPDDKNQLVTDRLTKEPHIVFSEQQPGMLWIEAHIPKDFAGTSTEIRIMVYKSTAFQDEEKVKELILPINVHPYVLPEPKDYTFFLDLWQHSSNVARQYGLPLWSDDHFAVLEKVVASLAKLGQKSVMIVASECPWCGWGTHIGSKDGTSFYEFSMILLRKNQKGELVGDFRHMQRYIDLCKKYHIESDISLYGLLGVWQIDSFQRNTLTDYPENISVRYWDEASGMYGYLKTKAEYQEYVQCIFHYFKETNQFEKLRIAADEPKIIDTSSIQRFREILQFFTNIEPDVKFKLAVDKELIIDTFLEDIETMAMSFPCTVNHPEIGSKAADKRLLWYVCNIPDKPNTLFKNEPIESRVLGSLNALFNLEGMIRWAYTAWTIHPREDIRYEIQGFPTGDFSLVYPAKNGEIEPSIRLKQLEKGIIDFELLNRLKEQGKEEEVLQAYALIGLRTDFTQYMATKRLTYDDLYSYDYHDYETMRDFVVGKLL